MSCLKESKSAPLLGESIITAISIGFTLLLVGILFIITPNLLGEIIDLLGDFELVEVVSNSNLIFLGPAFPNAHNVVYVAAAQFCLVIGLFQIVVFALRFLASSQWGKKAETVGNLVFWLGTWFLIQSFLLETTQWFVFWSTIIMLIGVSLIARAGAMAASRI